MEKQVRFGSDSGPDFGSDVVLFFCFFRLIVAFVFVSDYSADSNAEVLNEHCIGGQLKIETEQAVGKIDKKKKRVIDKTKKRAIDKTKKRARKKPAARPSGGQDQRHHEEQQALGDGQPEAEQQPDDCGAEGSDETHSEEPTEIPIVKLNLRPGHGNKMTIVAVGSSCRDKAQLLEVSGSMCEGTDMTPSVVCQKVLEAIEEHAVNCLGCPDGVAKAEGLSLVRELAREHRAQILGMD